VHRDDNNNNNNNNNNKGNDNGPSDSDERDHSFWKGQRLNHILTVINSITVHRPTVIIKVISVFFV
jgi:hypothetical protein